MNWTELQNSLQQALSPESIKLDDRSEMDLLSFAAQYSELILYYDRNNNQQGNWRDFFLKAPQILLASISKTNYQLPLRQFNALVGTNNQDSSTVNLLCDLIQTLFVHLNDWLVQMKSDHREYALKSYLEQQVCSSLSKSLWLFIEIQKRLMLAQEGIKEPDFLLYQSFSPLWRFQRQSEYQPELDPVTELQLIFKTIFSIYVNVIDSADSAYNSLKNEINNHPDTALLISFVRLLKTHQKQLNKISQKHIDFYYRNILQQTELQQTADQVYLCITLAEQEQAYTLVKDVAFNAGLDSKGQPIIFTNLCEQQLNQAKIKQVQQVNYQRMNDDNILYISQPRTVAEIKQDQEGQMLSWPLFYQAQPASLQQIKHSLAIASPMLYLQGGERDIKLVFHFTRSVDNNPFINAGYYLTSAQGWLDISEYVITAVEETDKEQAKTKRQISIAIKLDNAIAPICQSDAADNIQSSWPLLKIVFSEQTDLKHAPKISKIDLGVEVSVLQHGITLSNDHGLLAVDAPFLPFGPVVNAGSSFYVASAEAFAKPLTSLCLTLDWSNLPDDFKDYYQQYNDYLEEVGKQAVVVTPRNFNNRLFKIDFAYYSQNRWCNVTAKPLPVVSQNLESSEAGFSALVNLFQPLKDDPIQVDDNRCSSGFWAGLRHKLELAFKSKSGLNSDQGSFTSAPGKDPTPAQDDKRTLAEFSSFELTTEDLPACSALRLNNQQPSSSAPQTRIRIKLQQPEFGFGHVLFDKVIAWVSQKNSLILLKQTQKSFFSFQWGSKKQTSESLPNQPFAPTVKQLTVSYKAQTSIDFTTSKKQPPFELYHYGSFNHYPVFNNSSLQTNTNQHTVTDLALFAELKFTNSLYFEVENITAPCQLSFYFQLADQNPETVTEQDDNPRLSYLYLSDTGWKPLTVLSDSTDMLNFSGIIEFNIPDDICNQSLLMPGKNYWICIASNSDIQASAVYINTQVVKAQRIINQSTVNSGVPILAAGTINSVLTASAVLDSIEQPFSSFNGKGRETTAQFYQRVSQRLANKDRVVSSSDYRTMALSADDNLFYCKLLPNPKAGVINLLLVSAYADQSLAGAFNPKVNACRMAAIEQTISQRTSAFVNVQLQNPNPIKVKIKASIICPLTRQNAVCQQVNRALKLFLSPWIKGTSQEQIKIDTGLTQAQVMSFIASQKDVEGVLCVELINEALNEPLEPLTECSLLVSAQKHQVKVISTASLASVSTPKCEELIL